MRESGQAFTLASIATPTLQLAYSYSLVQDHHSAQYQQLALFLSEPDCHECY